VVGRLTRRPRRQLDGLAAPLASPFDHRLRQGRTDAAARRLVDDDVFDPCPPRRRDREDRQRRHTDDAPVVIAGDKNLSKVKPYLGDRYYEFNYRLIWWPTQTYFGLTWERIWNGIKDPVQRGQFWDVVLNRRYTTPTTQWSLVHRFSLFVRKDVAAQVWGWPATP
jgi:hypothetical protein